MSSLYIPSSSFPPSVASPALTPLLNPLFHLSTSSCSFPFPDKRRNSSRVPAFICRSDGGNSWPSMVQDRGYKRIGPNINSRVYVPNNWSTQAHELHGCCTRAVSKVSSRSEVDNFSDDDNSDVKKSTRKSKQPSRTRRKKLIPEDTGFGEGDEEAEILGAEFHEADRVMGAVSNKFSSQSEAENFSDDDNSGVKKSKRKSKQPSRTRKKLTPEDTGFGEANEEADILGAELNEADRVTRAVDMKVTSQSEAESFSDIDDSGVKKRTRKSKQPSRTRKKKLTPEGTGSGEADPEARILDVGLREADRVTRAVSMKVNSQSEAEHLSDDDNSGVRKSTRKSKRLPTTSRKKLILEDTVSDEADEADILDAELHKADRDDRRQKKGTSSSREHVKAKKKTREKKDIVQVESASDNEDEQIDLEESELLEIVENEKEEFLIPEDTEDISYTYDWPPLVCCYGAALHAFVPSGRPANRLIDHSIHKGMEDAFWCPTKFVRAPGRSSFSVALALAGLGGRVAFMGKVGADAYGQHVVSHLNNNNVQTRSVKIDGSKSTAVSLMKISRKEGLKMTPVKSSAEDNLLRSELNIDVLKEAKMFYFNSSSLLDRNTRTTTMHAVKIAKKFGAMIFFDPNLPLPLWHSKDETIMNIQQAWNYADFIELTKQELEFICGIKSTERFDTKDNDLSKFLHYKPEVVMPFWHENLKVLFVTNGTSKIHYYTHKDNGWVRGTEDAPVTPFTADMSVAGDAIVAALMRMLTVQADLTTDKRYLEHAIKYAVSCGVTDQWIAARVLGFPPKEEINGTARISEREYRTVGPDAD